MHKFYITADAEVFADSYEDGELESVNWFAYDPAVVEAKTPKEAILKYLSKVIQASTIYGANLSYDEETEDFSYSLQVDNDSVAMSAQEYEQWKLGKFSGYRLYCTLQIKELVKCLYQ